MAIETVFCTADTTVGTHRLRLGDHWPAADPLVLAHPDLFSTDPRYGLRYTTVPAGYRDDVVETATAAPGERRSSSRARS